MQDQAIDKALEATKLGHWIHQYEKKVIVTLIAIIICSLAFAGYKIYRDRQLELSAEQNFVIFQKYFDGYLNGKTTKEDFLKLWDEFLAKENNIQSNIQLIPVLMPVISKMHEENLMSLDKIQVLASWYQQLTQRGDLALFLGLKLAVLYEDHDKYAEAVSILENLYGHEGKMFKEKILYDLARLYKKLDNDKLFHERLKKLKNDFPNGQYQNWIKFMEAGF